MSRYLQAIDRSGQEMQGIPVELAVDFLLHGQNVGVRLQTGMLLLANAEDSAAIARLRQRLHPDLHPLHIWAVAVEDLEPLARFSSELLKPIPREQFLLWRSIRLHIDHLPALQQPWTPDVFVGVPDPEPWGQLFTQNLRWLAGRFLPDSDTAGDFSAADIVLRHQSPAQNPTIRIIERLQSPLLDAAVTPLASADGDDGSDLIFSIAAGREFSGNTEQVTEKIQPPVSFLSLPPVGFNDDRDIWKGAAALALFSGVNPGVVSELLHLSPEQLQIISEMLKLNQLVAEPAWKYLLQSAAALLFSAPVSRWPDELIDPWRHLPDNPVPVESWPLNKTGDRVIIDWRPGFSNLCEPAENPVQQMQQFLGGMVQSWLKGIRTVYRNRNQPDLWLSGELTSLDSLLDRMLAVAHADQLSLQVAPVIYRPTRIY